MMNEEMMAAAGAVFVQTNEEANRVLAFARDADGNLAEPVSYETGGRGSATPHLPSQGSVVVSGDGRSLLVANAGSGAVSVFLRGAPDPIMLSNVTGCFGASSGGGG